MWRVNDNGESDNFAIHLTLINCLSVSYEFLISSLILSDGAARGSATIPRFIFSSVTESPESVTWSDTRAKYEVETGL